MGIIELAREKVEYIHYLQLLDDLKKHRFEEM